MQKCNENAANRYSYVGEVYNIGEKDIKRRILDGLNPEWKALHENGYIHIHDLDAYGLTYNCLTFNILADFPFEKFKAYTVSRKITAFYDYLKSLFSSVGNEQSGGMALANYDNDTAEIFLRIGVDVSKNEELIRSCTADLIEWCNDTHTRMGQTSYYVTLNVGLAKNEDARKICLILLDEFEKSGDMVYKPNIVFKVAGGINRYETDKNYYLYKKSLLCTAKKMIPTYLLCDSAPNRSVNPEKIGIMGCRTRVVANVFGEDTSVGRGNIANISVNLPRIALETDKECINANEETKIRVFSEKWDCIANVTKDILIDRYIKVCKRQLSDFPINAKHKLWLKDFSDCESVFKNGTLSIGFIGLSEAIEVLTGKRFYADEHAYKVAVEFVKHMRRYCDELREKFNLNFSLLATSGELISGRFIDYDKKIFPDRCGIFTKGFYTNSFHVNVDSDLIAFDKIRLEGPFHEMCNGGSITYVELKEAPLCNDEGLREYVECAIKNGVHYLGFNFPKDVCNECGASGVFDVCPECGSKNITRIRRVSGYLEVLDGFTAGKKNEVKTRKEN